MATVVCLAGDCRPVLASFEAEVIDMSDWRLTIRKPKPFRLSGKWLTWFRMVLTLTIVGICMLQAHGPNLKTRSAALAKQQAIVFSSAITLSCFSSSDPQIKTRALDAYGKLPLSFEANQGQAAAPIKFVSRGSGYSILLGADEAVLKLRDASLRLKPVGANPAAQIQGEMELAGKSHYLFGNNASQWLTDVPTFAKVRYEQIYPGVNLVYYGNQRQLEYDFVVAPGADASVIRLSIEGAQQMQVDGDGDLVLSVAGGELRQHKPIIYQQGNGERQLVAGSYVVEGKNQIGFKLGDYDHSRELVIDPVLSYSTYLGGGGGDQGNGIAVDKDGNVYVTGYTTALNEPNTTGNVAFPTTPNPYQAVNNGLSDVFVSKLDTSKAGAASLVYSTFIGAPDEDQAQAIKSDATGNIYITGQTTSTAFPTTANAYQRSFGSSALFKSSDAAAQWIPSGNGLSANAVNALVVDGANLIAGTANNGVYKSTDGGTTWTPSNGTVDLQNPSRNTTIGSNDIRALAIVSGASGVVYAATSNGVFRSVNGGVDWLKPDPRFPTDDNGRAIKNAVEDARSLAVDLKSATRTLYFGTSGGVFKSTDGGKTAVPANAGLPGFNAETGLSTTVIQALVVDPMTAGKVFAATSDGVYRSDNGGTSWTLKSPANLTDKSIQALAIQPGAPAAPETPNTPAKPATPDTLFAVTRSGVFKTTDGGDTWAAFNTGLPNTDAQSGLTTLSIRALALGSDAIYVATSDSVYKRNLASGNWTLSNTGQTSADIRSLAIGSGTNVFVGAKGETDAFLLKLSPDGKSLLYSTFLGGGNSDRANGLALGIPGLEDATKANDTLVYLTGATSSANFPRSAASAALAGRDDAFAVKINTVATNAAASRIYSMLFGGSGNDGANGIAVDSTGAAYLTGGTNSADFARPNDAKSLEPVYRNTGLFFSENDAASWTRSGNGLIGDVADAIVVDRKTPATLYAVNFNGVFKSTNSGGSWTSKNTGLISTNVRVLVLDPTDSNKLYAGTAGGVFKSTNGGDSWSAINSGLTGSDIKSLAIDLGVPATLYAGLGFGGLFKSINGGASWTAINGSTGNFLPNTNAASGRSTANIQVISLIPAAMANTPAQTIYVGLSGGVYKSADGGANWTPVNGTINSASTTETCPRCLPGTKVKTGESAAQISDLAIDLPSTLYASLGKDGLFKSTDGGANWDRLTLSAQVLALALEPGKPMAEPPTPTMLYAATNAGVFKSTDGGASWTASNSGLTSSTIRSLAIDASDKDKIKVYAGNGGGSGDAFVAKLSADGAKLEYFSYLGGGDSDTGYGIAVGTDNTAYVVGSTSSSNFRTTTGAYKTGYGGGGDAFVSRIDLAKTGGESLLYSTFLGGSQSQNNDSPNDSAQAIVVDAKGVVYVTGSTTSTNFPILNSLNPSLNGSSDVFVTALDPTKSGDAALVFSTYLGGNNRDTGLAIAQDATGAVYVTGATLSANFPISSGAFDKELGAANNSDAFVAKISGMTDAVDLSLIKTAVGTGEVRVGDKVTYQLVVKNNSDSTAATAPIRVIDQLPAELSFDSASGPGWICSAAGQVVTCVNPSSLAAEASSTILLTVKVNAAATRLVNTATVSSLIGDSDPTNNISQSVIVNVAPACTYTLSAAGQQFSPSGGNGSVTVAAPAGCQWQAAVTQGASFITLQTTSGTGTQMINFTVSAFTDQGQRTGELTIAGQKFAITQTGCSYSITPDKQDFDSSGGNDNSVAVTATGGCSWTATVGANSSFITITSGTTGTDNGTVKFNVARNSSTDPRTGTMTIAGKTFVVQQAGLVCTYTLSATEQSVPAAGGVMNSVTVTAPAGCSWTATSNDSFVTISSGASGNGDGSVVFSVAENTAVTARTGTITIAGQTFTVRQAGFVCVYSLSVNAASFQADGTAITAPGIPAFNGVAVITGNNCEWQAVSNNTDFITINGDGRGKGKGSFSFTVKPNTTTNQRSGTISIADQTFTVTQFGEGCSFELNLNEASPISSRS